MAGYIELYRLGKTYMNREKPPCPTDCPAEELL